jgi:hypothetical protein
VTSWTNFSCSNRYKIHLKLLKFLSPHEHNSNVSKCTIFLFFLSSFNFRSLLIHKKIVNVFFKKSSKDSKSSKTIWCMCINKFTFKVVPKLWQQRQSLFLAHRAWRSFACPKSHPCKEIFHLFWIFFSSINCQPSFTTLLTLLIQPFLATWVVKQDHVLHKQKHLGRFGSFYCGFTWISCSYKYIAIGSRSHICLKPNW